VWDVSHQAYAYKILTGRRDRFATLRQYGGISGFLNRAESPYDAFGAGHSGTAISAALGIAAARDRQQGSEHVIAVVGDGSLGNGISLEALNNVAGTTRRLIVILNDNEMSISANVGSLAGYLASLLANPRYNRWKHSVESAIGRHARGFNRLRRLYYRMEEAIKGLFLHSVMFEEMGLRYIGPVDGHNMAALLSAFEIARASEEPIVIHVSTQKGRGYSFAENSPAEWHGTTPFDVESGEATGPRPQSPSYSKVCGTTLMQIAEKEERLVAITAAMCSGTGLNDFAARFPARFFDVGIAEEHAVTFAAGLAARGLIPVFAVYSSFAQRAVDSMIHDVALQNLPVILCLDRAGIVGDDGPTHHGVFDIALFRTIPNLIIMQPKDEAELALMLHSAVAWRKPVVIRYPRGRGPGTPIPTEFVTLNIGEAETIREGNGVQIWALGDMLTTALRTATLLEADGIKAGVVNARFVRPLDRALLARHAASNRLIVTVENALASGGFGAAVEEALGDLVFQGRVIRLGWPDEFVPHGAHEILCERFGMTAAALAARIKTACG